MTDLKTRRGAIGVIIRGNEFLVIERSPWVRAPGKLCFPGGGIELGETAAEAVTRELQEELRLIVRPVRLMWQSQSRSGIQLNWWHAEMLSKHPPIPNPAEVASFAWLNAEAMSQHHQLLPTNRQFLEALQAGDIAIAP